MCAFDRAIIVSGEQMTFAPPANASAALAAAQALAGEMDRDERRRAGRVDRQRGTAQPEAIGDPPGGDAGALPDAR